MRKRRGLVEEIIDLAAALPWWAGVGLALVLYFLLHSFAAAPAPMVAGHADMGKQVASQLTHMVALILQYVIPLALLLGAAVSVFKQNQRRRLHGRAIRGETASTINGLTWQEFELLIGEAFRRRGYRVEETGSASGDGGVDLILAKEHERFFVQCKHWRAMKVNVATVRELYGVMAAQAAAGGFVVTSGQFTKDAKAFASGRNIELIDGAKLAPMLRHARTAATPAPSVAKAVNAPGPAPLSSLRPTDTAPVCPVCGAAMIKRIAKHGSFAGRGFWGCPRYPGCRGTRQIA